MTITTEPPSELAGIEDEALSRLDSDAGRVEADVELAADAAVEPALEPERSPGRVAIAATLPAIAAAVMVGGVFQGVAGRVYAVVAALLGVGLAYLARRIRRSAVLNVVIALGLLAIGLLVVLPTGASNVFNVQALAKAAADSGRALRPPLPLTPGWVAIVGWMMGIVGFAAVWIAVVVKRPSLGLILPLPIAAIAGISVPKDQQVGSGLAVLGLFAVGLAVLSSAQAVGEDDQQLPIGYELRKTAKSIAVLIPVLALLYLAAQANFLFPRPAIDPTQKPQKPKVTPLSEAPDRVLFSVQTKEPQIPLRTGSLDIYDGTDWLLPAFADTRLTNVPSSGVIDQTVTAGVEAEITIEGLTGAVLPTLPNPVGIVANGPQLAYDGRSDNIRVAQGQVQAGLQYTITGEALPTETELREVTAPIPVPDQQFAQIGPPPPAVVALINEVTHADKWDEWNALRLYVLDNVVASGLGTPISVPISRVQAILADPKAGASPFEIVAVQALLARWVGIPSRIGYGFRIDANDPEIVDGAYQIRPKDGVAFPEVYFPGFEWLPVIGDPRLARPTVASANEQQNNPNTHASNDISVQVFLPVIVPPHSTFFAQLRNDVLLAIPIIALLLLIYVLYPGVRKARLRSKRRKLAMTLGPRARIGLAYTEFRDYATDFGFRHQTDTPLMFLDRVAPDDEHAELAWLVTRAQWGDFQEELTDGMAIVAEGLSRSLQRRLGGAQPPTLRFVAALSRLSLRSPYAPDVLTLSPPKEATKDTERELQLV